MIDLMLNCWVGARVDKTLYFPYIIYFLFMNAGGVGGGHSEIVSGNGGDFIEVLFHIPLTKKSGICKNWIGFCESF